MTETKLVGYFERLLKVGAPITVERQKQNPAFDKPFDEWVITLVEPFEKPREIMIRTGIINPDKDERFAVRSICTALVYDAYARKKEWIETRQHKRIFERYLALFETSDGQLQPQ